MYHGHMVTIHIVWAQYLCTVATQQQYTLCGYSICVPYPHSNSTHRVGTVSAYRGHGNHKHHVGTVSMYRGCTVCMYHGCMVSVYHGHMVSLYTPIVATFMYNHCTDTMPTLCVPAVGPYYTGTMATWYVWSLLDRVSGHCAMESRMVTLSLDKNIGFWCTASGNRHTTLGDGHTMVGNQLLGTLDTPTVNIVRTNQDIWLGSVFPLYCTAHKYVTKSLESSPVLSPRIVGICCSACACAHGIAIDFFP